MGWMMFDESEEPKAICNFNIKVLTVVNEHTSTDAEPVTKVKLALDFGNEQLSEDFTVPLSQLEGVKWLDKYSRSRFHPEFSPSKAQRYLADHVRELLPTGTPKSQYRINRVGNCKLENEHIFRFGQDYISSSPDRKDDYDIVLDPIPYNMDIDPSLSEAEAAAEMLELISLNPDVGRVLMSHTLMYLMRSVYQDAWKAPRSSVFVYGDTGTYKTTYSAFLTQLYNRADGIKDPVRLDASIPAAVEILYGLDDCTVVLDDLFPADSSRMKAQQEETLIEITRIIGDGTTPARMKGGKLR